MNPEVDIIDYGYLFVKTLSRYFVGYTYSIPTRVADRLECVYCFVVSLLRLRS